MTLLSVTFYSNSSPGVVIVLLHDFYSAMLLASDRTLVFFFTHKILLFLDIVAYVLIY